MAVQVDRLYLGLVLISAFYLAIIFLPMIYFLFKYRRGHKANRAPIRIKTWKIEVALDGHSVPHDAGSLWLGG